MQMELVLAVLTKTMSYTNARTMQMLTMSGAGINAMRRAVALALSTETRGTPLSVRFGAVQSIRLRV
jgi:spore maturation protein SpmB